jgi:hypothetical protein
MPSTSVNQPYGTEACLAVDLIEGLFTAFAQRRFERGSGTCVLIKPPVGNPLDHSSSEWCDRSGLGDKPAQCYSFISNHEDASSPGDTSLPGDSMNDHRICMIYDTDPDGDASRIADSKQKCPLSAVDH